MRAGSAMRISLWDRNSRLGYAAAAVAFAVDQTHKWWMLSVLGITELQKIEVTGFFDLVLVWNPGVSYGLFPQDSELGRLALIGFVLAAILLMALWLAVTDSPGTALALGLVIGGALGNVADRLIHGAVADFFSFHAFGYHWYIFNLADVAIVAGVAILLYDSFRDRGRGQGIDSTGPRDPA